MRKLKDLMLSLSLMMAGLFIIASCSDDDKDDKTPDVPTVEGMESMEVERVSDFYTIHLNCEGEWKAVCADEWLSLNPSEGNGPQDIQIFVEDNLSNEDRAALIAFESEGGDSHFTLTQTMMMNGEYPDSNDAVLDLYVSRGLGKGYDIKKGEIRRNAVFNWRYLKEMVDGKEFEEDVFENYSPSKLEDLTPVSTETQEVRMDKLKVTATVGITYLSFEFKIHAHYLGTTINNKGHRVMNSHYIVPKFKGGFTDPSYLGQVYDEWSSSEDKEIQKKAGNIFTSSFRQQRNKIIANKGNAAERKKAVAKLNGDFGPVYVSGSMMGGEMSLNLSCDSTHVADLLDAGGAIEASIKGAAWSVDVEAAADYYRKIENLMKKMTYEFIIQGGDTKYHQTLHDAYITTGTTPTETMNAWKESITNENSEMISLEFSGIWNLFPDDVSDLVRDDLIEIYRGKEGTVINLDDMN